MTGYVRKDTTNNIADGNVINAADLDAEFDGVKDAFQASTGHKHDGTTGEGAPITSLGPNQDVTISATLLAPKTTNTVDIGSSALKFKDLFLAGNGSVGGTLAVTGVATFSAGSASTPALTTAGDTNTGMFFPAADTIAFSEGGAEVARFDSSGNLGLGATPTNNTLGKTLQVGQAATWTAETGTNRWWLGSNWYFNSTDKYINNGHATLYSQQNGAHQWFTAASGTAGNTITFTEGMRLDSSANLLVGTTSSFWSNSGRGVIEVNGSSSAIIGLKTGGTARGYIYTQGTDLIVSSSSGACSLQTAAATPVILGTDNVERARIDSSGRFGIGTSTPFSKLDLGSYGSQSQLSWHQDSTTSYGHIGIQNTSAAIALMAGLKMGSTSNSFASSISSEWAKSAVLLNYGKIQFFTNPADTVSYGTTYTPTERARIDSGGNFMVGTTTGGGTGGVTLYPNGSGSSGQVAIAKVADGVTNNAMAFLAGSSVIGTVSISNTNTAYNTSSDYRLKNTIAPMTGALAKVALLKPCTYKWNVDGSNGQGFIAHELAEVCPQAVTGEKDAVDENGNPQYQGIDVSFLVATLTAAIQEQQAIIESLKARLDAANL